MRAKHAFGVTRVGHVGRELVFTVGESVTVAVCAGFTTTPDSSSFCAMSTRTSVARSSVAVLLALNSSTACASVSANCATSSPSRAAGKRPVALLFTRDENPRADVGRDDRPEKELVGKFAVFVPEPLLREERARPAAAKLEPVQGVFRQALTGPP